MSPSCPQFLGEDIGNQALLLATYLLLWALGSFWGQEQSMAATWGTDIGVKHHLCSSLMVLDM
jgi:hypothetical protein